MTSLLITQSGKKHLLFVPRSSWTLRGHSEVTFCAASCLVIQDVVAGDDNTCVVQQRPSWCLIRHLRHMLPTGEGCLPSTVRSIDRLMSDLITCCTFADPLRISRGDNTDAPNMLGENEVRDA